MHHGRGDEVEFVFAERQRIAFADNYSVILKIVSVEIYDAGCSTFIFPGNIAGIDAIIHV